MISGPDYVRRLREGVGKVVVGVTDEREVISRVFDRLITGLLSGGNILIVGKVGLGKTFICGALAKAVGTEFLHIQGQPDLLPGDILPSVVPVFNPFNPQDAEPKLMLIPGVITEKHGIVLADEINRCQTKFQSALLEPMEQKRISVGGKTIVLNPMLFFLATENPLETGENYPLPEAQWDRFMMKVRIDYLSKEKEIELGVVADSLNLLGHEALEQVEQVTTEEEILKLRDHIRLNIRIARELVAYIVDVVWETRFPSKFSTVIIEGKEEPLIMKNGKSVIRAGASPRGEMGLIRAAKVEAWKQGRDFVLPEDIKKLAVEVLAHRVFLEKSVELRKSNFAEAIVERAVEVVECPTYSDWERRYDS